MLSLNKWFKVNTTKTLASPQRGQCGKKEEPELKKKKIMLSFQLCHLLSCTLYPSPHLYNRDNDTQPLALLLRVK